MTNKKERQRMHYPAGSDFKGTGKLRCGICNGKLRDHAIGARCPDWDGILAARIIATGRGNTPGNTAERKRKWRADNPGRN